MEDSYQIKAEGPLNLSFLIYKMGMIRDLVIKEKDTYKTLKIIPWSIILNYYVNNRTIRLKKWDPVAEAVKVQGFEQKAV